MSEKVTLDVLDTGISGLNAVLGGGLPALSFNILGGAPGSGKTTLAQQLMFSLARPDRRALFFTALGELPIKMLRYQQQFSFFDFDKIDQSVKFVNLIPDLAEGNFDKVLDSIIAEVEAYAPSLVFIDSFRSVINAAEGEAAGLSVLQQFVQRLALQMTGWQATTFLIGEYQLLEVKENPLFTIADGIIWLSQNIHRNAMMRKLQVVKMRGQAQLPGMHTFRIDRDGLSIFPRIVATAAQAGDDGTAPPRARLGTGVAEFDAMLGGGLPAGHAMLLSGPAGAGKSRLAQAFLAEGVRICEAGVVATFEHTAGQRQNARLRALADSGRVGVISLRKVDLSFDETLHDIVEMIEQMQAQRVVFDSLSAFELALAPEFREDFREALYRLLNRLADQGVTVMLINEADQAPRDAYGSTFLADTLVVQRYVEVAGCVRTLLNVVRVRDSAHSRDWRLMEVTADAIHLAAEPFVVSGAIGA